MTRFAAPTAFARPISSMRANRWWCRHDFRDRGSFWCPRINGGARRDLPTGPLIDQPACKPGSVGRGASPARDGHSSGTPVARRLEQPTRTAGPGHRSGNLAVPAPSLFGFAPGGVYRAVSVAGNAVRSYRTVSPLPARLPSRRCEIGAGGRFVFCGTVPGVAPAGPYPAPHVHGARTFLPGSLSASTGAAVRPTDDHKLGALDRGVKSTPVRRRVGAAAAFKRPAAPTDRRAAMTLR